MVIEQEHANRGAAVCAICHELPIVVPSVCRAKTWVAPNGHVQSLNLSQFHDATRLAATPGAGRVITENSPGNRSRPIYSDIRWAKRGLAALGSGQSDGTQGTDRRGSMTGLPIDQLMKELVTRASEVVDLQDRLQGLLHASRLITSELSLDGVLERIVDVARNTVDAQYAALGVIGRTGPSIGSSTPEWTRRRSGRSVIS